MNDVQEHAGIERVCGFLPVAVGAVHALAVRVNEELREILHVRHLIDGADADFIQRIPVRRILGSRLPLDDSVVRVFVAPA